MASGVTITDLFPPVPLKDICPLEMIPGALELLVSCKSSRSSSMSDTVKENDSMVASSSIVCGPGLVIVGGSLTAVTFTSNVASSVAPSSSST